MIMQLKTFTLFSVFLSMVCGRPDGAQNTDEAIAPPSDENVEQANQANQAMQSAIANLERFASLAVESQNQTDTEVRFSHVRFVMPLMSTIRNPDAVASDVRTIYWTLGNNLRSSANRLQQLLFERLLINDLRFGTESLGLVDRYLTETYKVLYESGASSPNISTQRQTQIDNTVSNLMILRRPLVAVLYSENLHPDVEGLARFNAYLNNTVLSLELPRYPQNREERMIGDILRGLEVISHRVALSMRQAHQARQSTFSTSSASGCTRCNTALSVS